MSAQLDDLDNERWARWVFDTCRLFGVLPEDAARTAALFVEGVRAERARRLHSATP